MEPEVFDDIVPLKTERERECGAKHFFKDRYLEHLEMNNDSFSFFVKGLFQVMFFLNVFLLIFGYFWLKHMLG